MKDKQDEKKKKPTKEFENKERNENEEMSTIVNLISFNCYVMFHFTESICLLLYDEICVDMD